MFVMSVTVQSEYTTILPLKVQVQTCSTQLELQVDINHPLAVQLGVGVGCGVGDGGGEQLPKSITNGFPPLAITVPSQAHIEILCVGYISVDWATLLQSYQVT